MLRASLSALVSLALAACGGSTDVDTKGAGGGTPTSTTSTTSTTTSTTSTTTVPAECAAPSSSAGPYAVTFRFTNSGPDPVLVVADGCGPVYSVFACADGYSAALLTYADCVPPCGSNPGPCPQCGACEQKKVSVEPGKTADAAWGGEVITLGNGPSCTCVEATTAAPAAKYRAKVNVQVGFSSMTEERTVDFELPAKDGVVTFDLGPKGL